MTGRNPKPEGKPKPEIRERQNHESETNSQFDVLVRSVFIEWSRDVMNREAEGVKKLALAIMGRTKSSKSLRKQGLVTGCFSCFGIFSHLRRGDPADPGQRPDADRAGGHHGTASVPTGGESVP
jgi:hypothetical protein